MLTNSPIMRVARVTLEATSPLSIASGTRDGFFDITLVKDALGLPAIPGTTLAGVLRRAFRERVGDDGAVRAIFGEAGEESRVSRLFITWGRIHDAGDNPVDGLPFQRQFAGSGTSYADPILGPLLALEPPHRDHVRLSHKGTPVSRGKFDRAFVPAGHRFTFGIVLHDDEHGSHQSDWDQLLDCIASPAFRLGGATRRGYGGCRIQRVLKGDFDLRTAQGLEGWCRTSARLNDTGGLTPAALSGNNHRALQLELSAQDFWRIGGSRGPDRTRRAKIADGLIYQEQSVQWREGSGQLTPPRLLIPASSIKGALSHRLAFHYNRLTGVFADRMTADEIAAHVEHRNKAVRALFGYVDGETARAGALVIEDGEVLGHENTKNTAYLMHTSIDRFTGGVREHVLFSEEALYRGSLRFRLFLDRNRLKKNLQAEELPGQSAPLGEALLAALSDLAEGRLSLGAGMAKGHGYFKGDLTADTLAKIWNGVAA